MLLGIGSSLFTKPWMAFMSYTPWSYVPVSYGFTSRERQKNVVDFPRASNLQYPPFGDWGISSPFCFRIRRPFMDSLCDMFPFPSRHFQIPCFVYRYPSIFVPTKNEIIKSKPHIFSAIFPNFWLGKIDQHCLPDVLPTLEAYHGGLRMDVAPLGVYFHLQEVEDAHSVSRLTSPRQIFEGLNPLRWPKTKSIGKWMDGCSTVFHWSMDDGMDTYYAGQEYGRTTMGFSSMNGLFVKSHPSERTVKATETSNS